jgi:hypothetical protein
MSASEQGLALHGVEGFLVIDFSDKERREKIASDFSLLMLYKGYINSTVVVSKLLH